MKEQEEPIENADGGVTAAAELRQRVYTLFFNAYDKARRAIAFLRWSEGDAHEIAPSLMALRTKKTAVKPGVEVAVGVEPLLDLVEAELRAMGEA